MENESKASVSPGWEAKQVYALAVVCLLIGLVVGYLFRGSRSSTPPPTNAIQAAMSPAPGPGQAGGPTVTLEQMKQMADKQAEPLLAKLKDDPKSADLLAQIGGIYLATHQFEEAAGYFGRSLEIKPTNIAIRTQLASCLYYAGDVDGALRQLTQATTEDPKDVNSLFNLGLIRYRGKKDSKGALEAWSRLLKANPKLEPGKKAQVERLMAEARAKNTVN